MIRPGRINFAIELTYMTAEPLCELIEHLMPGGLSPAQRQRAHRIARHGKVTAAR